MLGREWRKDQVDTIQQFFLCVSGYTERGESPRRFCYTDLRVQAPQFRELIPKIVTSSGVLLEHCELRAFQ